MVLPWGLASDSGCAALRRLLFDTCTLDSFRGFDNTDAVFPIHRSVRFLLLTATAGGRTESLPCRIGDRDPAVLDSDDDRSIVLTRALITRVSGDDLAIPDVRSPEDLSLLEKLVTSAPPLAGPAGWGVEFGRELNASDDRRHFTREPHGIPVLEGKHVRPFHADTAAVVLRLPRPAARTLYARTNAFRRPRLAYRDVASATNRLTLIAAVVPADTATVHTLFCLRGPVPERDQWFLCGILNSFVANYLVRLRVTTHVTAGILARLPVPKPADDSPAFKSIGRLARELSALPSPEQDERYALLQAHVAALYGLTESELAHVLARLPLIGEDIKNETAQMFERGMR